MSKQSEISVRVALMGALKEKAPTGNRLELALGATINDALRQLDIAGEQTQIVMRNGSPQTDRDAPLEDGDEITIIPLVGGG